MFSVVVCQTGVVAVTQVSQCTVRFIIISLYAAMSHSEQLLTACMYDVVRMRERPQVNEVGVIDIHVSCPCPMSRILRLVL